MHDDKAQEALESAISIIQKQKNMPHLLAASEARQEALKEHQKAHDDYMRKVNMESGKDNNPKGSNVKVGDIRQVYVLTPALNAAINTSAELRHEDDEERKKRSESLERERYQAFGRMDQPIASRQEQHFFETHQYHPENGWELREGMEYDPYRFGILPHELRVEKEEDEKQQGMGM